MTGFTISEALPMQFDGSRRSGQTPNLTPLIDIVFLLLVFFMLTAHFVRDEGIPIELPEAESAATLDDQKRVELTIDGSGDIRLNGTVTPLPDLEQAIRTALASSEDKSVTLKGDEDVSLGRSVAILDAARKAGAAGVNIVTRQPATAP